MSKANLDPFLHPTYDLLKRAYPDGIPERDYFPVLSVFSSTDISSRNLGLTLQALDGRNYAIHYYNLLHELPSRKIDPVDLARARAALDAAGFSDWLKQG